MAFSEITLSFKNDRENKKFPGIDKVWSYLKKRGINLETARICHLHVMPAIELIAAARKTPMVNAADHRAAIVFPHWKLGTDEPIEWWSSRLVDLVDEPAVRLIYSFAKQIDPEHTRRPGKMFCPPNEYPHGYLPPNYNWSGLSEGDKVYIHESAIKAINCAALGYASVGLNGVWGWASKKHGIALIEEIRDLPWKAKKLKPIIVFDSNAWDNWDVQEAESRLAAKLFEITHQRADSLRVPKHEGENQGFDDYRERHGDDVARAFLNGSMKGYGFVEVEISEFAQYMIQLSAEVCVVLGLGKIANQLTGDLMSRQTFTDVNYAHFSVLDDNNRLINVPKRWLADSRRVEVQSLEYVPGEDRLVRRDKGLPNLNLWHGMGCFPEPGDVEPWLELLTNNISDDDLRQWLIAWLAYPLQNLGKKILSYPIIFGPSGTGKNRFLYPFRRIYGRNYSLITRADLASDFNDFYTMKQLIHVDEIRGNGSNRDNVSQKIKYMISAETITVNRKGQPQYDITNCANFAITDNYWDCLKLDEDDRRACVIRWEPQFDRKGDQPYWTEYSRWAEEGGPMFLYHFLLNQDISWFDPHAWAPATPWKEEVKEATYTAIQQWVKDLWDDPKAELGRLQNGRSVFKSAELAPFFYGREREILPDQNKKLGNELKNRGFIQANEGKQVWVNGNPAKYWVIDRRDEEWPYDKAKADVENHPLDKY